MTPEQRAQMVIYYEGQSLSNVGQVGVIQAPEHARCIIDGNFNALIRMEGREAAAVYAFALADRVVGGLRAPNAIRAAEDRGSNAAAGTGANVNTLSRAAAITAA
jgi:hypothetical protein